MEALQKESQANADAIYQAIDSDSSAASFTMLAMLPDEKEIIERIGTAEIIVTNKTPISRNALEKCPNVRFIAVLATGYNVVDTDAARQRKIPVSNIPSYGTDSVAQFSIALLLEICHHIGHHSKMVHEGRWASCEDFCFWDSPLIELSGKTMGIVGYGRIGMATGNIARALGMRVLAFSPSRVPGKGENGVYHSPYRLGAQGGTGTPDGSCRGKYQVLPCGEAGPCGESLSCISIQARPWVHAWRHV